MLKRLISIAIAVLMVFGATVAVSAAEITTSGGTGDSIVTLDLTPRNLHVTIPSVLPINVDSDNNVTVATNAKINNLSEGPIEVTNVSVEEQNEWTIVSFGTDFTKVPVNTKQYGMTMYNDDVVDGVPASLFDVIDGQNELAVTYNGNVAIQSDAINHLDIGHVIFTVRWHDTSREDAVPILSVKETPRRAVTGLSIAQNHKYFVKQSSTLDTAIGTNFYIDFNGTPYEDRDMSDSSIKVAFSWGNKFTSGDGAGNYQYSESDSYVSEVTNLVPVNVDGKTLYVATLKQAPKELSDDITAELVVDGTVIDGIHYTTTDYFYDILNNPTYSESLAAKDVALINCCKTMLQYAAACQINFNYNTDNLANYGLDDFVWKTREEVFAEIEEIKSNSAQQLGVYDDLDNLLPAAFKGQNINFGSEIGTALLFNPVETSLAVNASQAVVLDKNGQPINLNISVSRSGKTVQLRISNIPFDSIFNDITWYVNGHSAVTNNSIFYILANEKGSEILKDTCTALYNYWDCVMIYANI